MLNFQNRTGAHYHKILLMMLFMLCFVPFIMNSHASSTKNSTPKKSGIKCNGYDIRWAEPTEENGYLANIEVYKGKQNVFTSEKDHAVSGAEDYCKKDFLGNKTPVVVVSTWSGGAHCCNTSYFLELGENFRLIQKMETYDSSIEFMSQGASKPYKLKVQDCIFNYFYTSFAYSVQPDVILKFNGDKFVFDEEAMLHKINKQEFEKLLANLEIKLEKDHDFIDCLDQVIALIYSGNADFAMQLIDSVLARYDFNKLTSSAFKEDLLCKIQKSKYILGIQKINQNKLLLPAHCKEDTLDDWVDYKRFRKTPL